MSKTVEQSLGKTEGLSGHKIVATERKVAIITGRNPLELSINGTHKLNLAVNYSLSLSTDKKFLAVTDSSFKVFPGETSVRSGPLVTFDYIRRPEAKDIPTAHINLHTNNDSLLHALAESGDTRRARNRRRKASQQANKGGATRSIHGSEGDVHIPLGGARFRPCLEDILEMLIVEFGVDPAPGNWRQVLAKGRKQWREHQLVAAVNDNPPLVVQKLRELGYTVEWNNSGHPPQPDNEKLARF